MPRARSPKLSEFTSLGIAVDRYSARAKAGINFQLFGSPLHVTDDDEPVHVFETILDVSGICTYPATRAGDRYDVTLLGESLMGRRLRVTVADLQKRSKTGMLQFRTYRGTQCPIYEEPPPLAFLEKVRGESRWTAWISLASQTVSDSLQILSGPQQVYLSIYEQKVARRRQIRYLAIQTTDPADE